MASNDRNSKAFCRCLKSIGISLNAALRVHVPRRKIAGPSTAALFIGRGNNCSRLPIFIWANPLEWREPAAACIPCCEANADRMRCDLCRKRELPVGSGVVENACKHIVGNRFKKSGSAGRKRAPTPCSPPYAASKTCVGPTSSIGGLAAPQPPDQKWDAPVFLRFLCNEAKNMLAAKK